MWRTFVAAAGVVSMVGTTAALGAPEGPCPPDRAAWVASAPEAAAADAAESSRLHLRGQKVAARPVNRAEAGVSWSLSPKVALELNYARNAFPPMFANDHDDGLMTRLKLGF
jgi:hypothetical protein